jgi:hypothetical protein
MTALLFLAALSLFALAGPFAGAATTDPVDLAALCDLHDAANGGSWTNGGWPCPTTTPDPCGEWCSATPAASTSWPGVLRCDCEAAVSPQDRSCSSGTSCHRVKEISLDNQNLEGTIATTISDMQRLEKL